MFLSFVIPLFMGIFSFIFMTFGRDEGLLQFLAFPFRALAELVGHRVYLLIIFPVGNWLGLKLVKSVFKNNFRICGSKVRAILILSVFDIMTWIAIFILLNVS